MTSPTSMSMAWASGSGHLCVAVLRGVVAVVAVTSAWRPSRSRWPVRPFVLFHGTTKYKKQQSVQTRVKTIETDMKMNGQRHAKKNQSTNKATPAPPGRLCFLDVTLITVYRPINQSENPVTPIFVSTETKIEIVKLSELVFLFAFAVFQSVLDSDRLSKHFWRTSSQGNRHP